MPVNDLLFVVLPYVAIVLAVVVTIVRWRRAPFTVSALSSQILESKKLFWGSVSFHWGLSLVLVGHLAALLVPRAFTLWNGEPLRLYLLEISGFALGLWAAFGITILIYRRFSNRRVSAVTTPMDLVVLGVIAVQIVTGLWIAVGYRWGRSGAPRCSFRTFGHCSSSIRDLNWWRRFRSYCRRMLWPSGPSCWCSHSPDWCTSSRCRWGTCSGHGKRWSETAVSHTSTTRDRIALSTACRTRSEDQISRVDLNLGRPDVHGDALTVSSDLHEDFVAEFVDDDLGPIRIDDPKTLDPGGSVFGELADGVASRFGRQNLDHEMRRPGVALLLIGF